MHVDDTASNLYFSKAVCNFCYTKVLDKGRILFWRSPGISWQKVCTNLDLAVKTFGHTSFYVIVVEELTTDRHKFLKYSVAYYYYYTMKHFYVMTKFWVWVHFVKGRVNDVCHEINYMKIISSVCVCMVCVVRKGGGHEWSQNTFVFMCSIWHFSGSNHTQSQTDEITVS